MSVAILLRLLRSRGVVLAVQGSTLAVRRGQALISLDELACLRANRATAIAAVSMREPGDPTLSSVLKRWHAMVGKSDTRFRWALKRTTGCDFDKRNPTAEEIRVFDAMLDHLELRLIAPLSAADCAPTAQGQLVTSIPANGQHQEATA